MTSKEQPERQPKSNRTAWKPPRGIRYALRTDRPNPYLLHWRGPDGKRHCVAYDSETVREKAAKTLVAKSQLSGRAVLNFSPEEWTAWERFRDMTGGADPVEVAKFWIAKGGARAGKSVSVSDLVKRYVEARTVEKHGMAGLGHVKKDLERIAGAFGALAADDLTAEAARKWMMALPFAPVTKGNHHRHGLAAWNWGMREGLCTVNPWRAVKRPRADEEEITVLTVEDARKLFATCREHRPDALPRLALEAFAGIRHSTAAALDIGAIDFSAEGIRIAAAKIKTKRAQYIDGLPANLWAFLHAAVASAWSLCGRDYERAKSDVFRLAGVQNPGNVLRHSFCTYHIAMHKDAARTAVILCHRSPTMLYQHYKGIAQASAGAAYFSIVPETKKPAHKGAGA